MTDKDILNQLTIKDENNNIKVNRHWKIIVNNNINIKEYLLSRYNDNISINESFARILYNIDNIPHCPVCGNILKFTGRFDKPYRTYCSLKCMANSAEVQTKKENTSLKNYGTKYFFQTDECKNLTNTEESLKKKKETYKLHYGVDSYFKTKECKEKCHSKEAINKAKKTCLNKYGVEFGFHTEEAKKKANSKEAKEKSKQTCLKNNGVEYGFNKEGILEKRIKNSHTKEAKEKSKQTCLLHYGVDNWGKTNESKIKTHTVEANEKRNNTNIKKYGYKNNFLDPDIISKRIINSHTPEANEKRNITKKKNNTFNKSKLEDKSYILLKEKYPDVIRQYKSELYPFNCDFYIPSLDLYIECNYSWLHGLFPYIETEQRCIDKLNSWKSKNTKFYNTAITTWTIRDVNKRNIAKENKLNYIELYNINEIYDFLNKHD